MGSTLDSLKHISEDVELSLYQRHQRGLERLGKGLATHNKNAGVVFSA